jgi:glycerophosphoryl diester phosphodiesterase
VTLVIAHRGAHGPGVPENTPAACERAIALGADMVEFDVRRSSNGRLIVSHDPPALDTTDDAPALAEVLDLCRDRIGIDVELKEPGYVPEVLALLPERGVLLTSFHEEVIRDARALAPTLRTGLIMDRAGASSNAQHLVLSRDLEPVPGCLMWTVNEPSELERFLADPAVFGVITDVPELALTLRARLSARTEPVAPS